jgi:hypothetical protein
MLNGFHDVACPRLTLCADHSCTFRNTAKRFAKVAAAADEGDFEGGFFDVIFVVGGGEDFGFVDVVYSDAFEDLQPQLAFIYFVCVWE